MADRTISFPFRIENGAVAATSDYQKVWQDRVLAAVGTALGERPMDRVDYGSSMARTLWANRDEASSLAVEQVTLAFQKHLPYLDLAGVDMYEVWQDDLESEYLQVDITYILPNGDEVTSEAVIGSIEPTGEINVYESYTIPTSTSDYESDLEVD